MSEVKRMTWGVLVAIAELEGWKPDDLVAVTTGHGHEAEVVSAHRNECNGIILIDLGTDVIIDTL
jgi:hypothetical protein